MIPAPITTRSKVSASSLSSVRARLTPPSYPDHAETGHAVVAVVPRDEREAVRDRGGGDPGVVDGQLPPHLAEPLREVRPGLGDLPIDGQEAQGLGVEEGAEPES